MRASTARLMNSPVRLADLTFPQVNRLIHRTRLAFVHLDNLLAFAKRDRDGRVDGYITAYLPEECLLLFFRKGEAVNAASLHTGGRQVVTITEALRRMRAEVERGELTYCAAPMEQLAWMYQSCAVPLQARPLDPSNPGMVFPALQQEKTSGVLELISDGRVSYLRFTEGRFVGGYYCDKPDAQSVGKFLEAQFQPGAAGAPPAISAVVFPPASDLPQQAPNALINTYRELYWRIVDEVEKEFPGEAKRRAQKVSGGIVGQHKAIAILSAARGAETPDAVVQPEELANALTDWSLQLLQGVEVIMPGTAPKILREATREHRYVLQSAGFYGRLPWQVTWCGGGRARGLRPLGRSLRLPRLSPEEGERAAPPARDSGEKRVDRGAVRVAAACNGAAAGPHGCLRRRAARRGSARADQSVRGDARRDPGRARGLLCRSPRPRRGDRPRCGHRQTRPRRASPRSGRARPHPARPGDDAQDRKSVV